MTLPPPAGKIYWDEIVEWDIKVNKMKAYTDIEQSKKLAEILPHITADNTWERVTIAGSNFNVPEEQQYVHRDMTFAYYSGIGLPSWSLAALLDYIKDKCGYFELVYLESTFDGRANKLKNVHRLSIDLHDVYEEEVIDACVKMVVWLKENNKI